MRFAIITPTIGRDTLKRCLITMKHQVYKNFLHIVVGDGPQEEWVEKATKENGCHYFCLSKAEKYYGIAPRNAALDLIESGKLGEFDYILFLDDDNILLEPALYNVNKTAVENDLPPLIWQDILFTNKFNTEYFVLPKCGKPLIQGDWDSLSGIFKSDILKGLRMKQEYAHDVLFAIEASNRADNKWVKTNGIGGVHFLSWDTWELPKPQ